MIKRSFMLLAAMLLAGFGAMAQSVQEAVVKVGALTVPAYTMVVDYDVDLVSNAMEQRLKDYKLKTRNVDGYVACIEQVVPEITVGKISLYTKVVREGRKNDHKSLVTVCAISNDFTIDKGVMSNNLRNFIEGFTTYLVKYKAQQDMKVEEGNLKKANKAQAAAVAAVKDIDDDIAGYRKKIEDRKAKIEKLKEEIKKCQSDIAELEAKIEKSQGQRSSAEKKVGEAEEKVMQVQGEVDRYREQSE